MRQQCNVCKTIATTSTPATTVMNNLTQSRTGLSSIRLVPETQTIEASASLAEDYSKVRRATNAKALRKSQISTFKSEILNFKSQISNKLQVSRQKEQANKKKMES